MKNFNKKQTQFFLIILFNLFLSAFTDTELLYTYKCVESNLKDNKCMTRGYNSYGFLEHLVDSSCKANEICATINEKYGACIKNTRPRVPGNKCKYAYECESGVCDENTNKCVGITEGSSCVSYTQCDSNYACSYYTEKFAASENKCQAMIESGECTTYDNEDNTLFSNCVMNRVCAYTDANSKYKNCVALGSLADGYYSNNKYACKSGRIQDNYCVSISESGECVYNSRGENVCTVKLIAPNQENSRNNLDGKSVSVSCIFSGDGNYQCPDKGEAETYKKYVDIFTEHYNKLVEKGDTEIVNNVAYRETVNNKDVSYWLFRYRSYYVIKNMDEESCVLNYLWKLNSSDKIGIGIGKRIFIILICIFLFI